MVVMQRALPASFSGMASRFCTWAGIRPSRYSRCVHAGILSCMHTPKCRNPMTRRISVCIATCMEHSICACQTKCCIATCMKHSICACPKRCCMYIGCANETKRHSRCGCAAHCGGCGVLPAGQPSCGGFLLCEGSCVRVPERDMLFPTLLHAF